MNRDLFARSPSGRLLKVAHGDAAYWAYIPNPLPPRSMQRLEEMGIVQRLDERQRYQRFVAQRILDIVQS